MNVPKGRILVKEILPTRNGIVLTDRPEYKKGKVTIGSTNIEVGEYVAFRRGEPIGFNGEDYLMVGENAIIFIGEDVLRAEIRDVKNPPRKVFIKQQMDLIDW